MYTALSESYVLASCKGRVFGLHRALLIHRLSQDQRLQGFFSPISSAQALRPQAAYTNQAKANCSRRTRSQGCTHSILFLPFYAAAALKNRPTNSKFNIIIPKITQGFRLVRVVSRNRIFSHVVYSILTLTYIFQLLFGEPSILLVRM